MPAANVFAPLIEVGGQANVGTAQGKGNLSFGMGGAGDNHVVAGLLLFGLIALVILHKSYKFSAKVSG